MMDNEERKVSFEVDCGSYEKKRNVFFGLMERLGEMKSVMEMKNV